MIMPARLIDEPLFFLRESQKLWTKPLLTDTSSNSLSPTNIPGPTSLAYYPTPGMQRFPEPPLPPPRSPPESPLIMQTKPRWTPGQEPEPSSPGPWSLFSPWRLSYTCSWTWRRLTCLPVMWRCCGRGRGRWWNWWIGFLEPLSRLIVVCVSHALAGWRLDLMVR